MEKFKLTNEATVADFRYAFSKKYEFLYFRVAKNKMIGNKLLSSCKGFRTGAELSFNGSQTIEQFETTAKSLIGADVELYFEIRKNANSKYHLCSKEYPGKMLDEIEAIARELKAFSQLEFMESLVNPLVESKSKNRSRWHYEQKDSEDEFFNWLKNFEMPDEDFDYDVEYMAIYDNISDLAGLQNWETIFEDVLIWNGKEVGEFLLKQLSDKGRRDLEKYYYWDGNWEGVLLNYGQIDAGSQYGGPITKEYIKVFSDNKHKRLIFKLFLVSLVCWAYYDLFPDTEDLPKQWWGYKISNY